MLTPTEALEQGYAIDNHAAGRPIAYRGPRYAPTAVQGIYTPLEMAYRDALARMGTDAAREALAIDPARL